MKTYNHGFVLGKFMPLHKGHIFLIETAQSLCKKLTVLLCSQPDDPIPGEVRLEWLRKQFPLATIVYHPEPLPRDQTNPLFWELWRKSIEKYCPGQKFDAVFSSEEYGPRLAQELHSQHVAVDVDRIKFPVSGTAIRSNPKAHKEFIPDSVKPYFNL